MPVQRIQGGFLRFYFHVQVRLREDVVESNLAIPFWTLYIGFRHQYRRHVSRVGKTLAHRDDELESSLLKQQKIAFHYSGNQEDD